MGVALKRQKDKKKKKKELWCLLSLPICLTWEIEFLREISFLPSRFETCLVVLDVGVRRPNFETWLYSLELCDRRQFKYWSSVSSSMNWGLRTNPITEQGYCKHQLWERISVTLRRLAMYKCKICHFYPSFLPLSLLSFFLFFLFPLSFFLAFFPKLSNTSSQLHVYSWAAIRGWLSIRYFLPFLPIC